MMIFKYQVFNTNYLINIIDLMNYFANIIDCTLYTK